MRVYIVYRWIDFTGLLRMTFFINVMLEFHVIHGVMELHFHIIDQ